MAFTIEINGDDSGVGATTGEVDCNGALCVSAIVGGMDVDGLAGGTFTR